MVGQLVSDRTLIYKPAKFGNPAEIWGAGDRIGTLEKGKLADLMIVDGDPMDVRTQIRHLFIKGKEITLSNKQVRLYERYMSRQ